VLLIVCRDTGIHHHRIAVSVPCNDDDCSSIIVLVLYVVAIVSTSCDGESCLAGLVDLMRAKSEQSCFNRHNCTKLPLDTLALARCVCRYNSVNGLYSPLSRTPVA
jgi:hypothetical protein